MRRETPANSEALRAIRAMQYNGWVTIELYPYVENPDEAAARGLKHITQILNFQ